MATDWNARFEVEGDAPVEFKVTVTHGQVGVSVVHFDGVEKWRGRDNPRTVPIAEVADEVSRKKVECTTTIADIRPETDTVGVIFEVIQGTCTLSKALEERSVSGGDSVNFTATITLEK